MKETQNNDCERSAVEKEPDWVWSEELICEFAEMVAKKYAHSEIWSNNFAMERFLMQKFKKEKIFSGAIDGLVTKDLGDSYIVDKEKLENILRLLDKYIQ